MNRSRRTKSCSVPLALSWSHDGAVYRVTPWPEVRFERQYGTDWVTFNPSIELLGAISAAVDPHDWKGYLEFAPIDVREFAGRFRANRLLAMQVAARCPALIEPLTDTPAFMPFVAAHAELRGTELYRWDELNAVFERGGLYALLEWLGLPASQQTMAIFRNIVSADLPLELLEALRSMLWRPEGILVLGQLPAITERELERTCHALAA